MRIADKTLQEVEKLIFEAVSAGVNMFDHADIYGKGDCERIFGVAVKDLGLERKNYIIQTKCGIRTNEKGKWFDFSREHILNSAENSLKRLNTEYIDVFLLHRPDTLIEADEVVAAFDKLKAEGKVRAFGVSNASAMQMEYLRKNGVEIVANQMQFSLGHTALVDAGFNVNMFEKESVMRSGEALEYARLHSIALQAWSPFQYGFFEGVFLGSDKYPALNKELEKVAEKYNATPSMIAVAWILRHPAFAQVITGTTSPERMKEMCKAADIKLSREDWYNLYISTGKILP
jgi:predicted oxidoreductase